MKRYIIATLVVFALSNCEIKVRDTKAQSSQYMEVNSLDIIEKNGMKYMVLYTRSQSSQTGYGIAVVNLSKDKVEMELMQAQLDEIRNKKAK
jgi:hypothetical protein